MNQTGQDVNKSHKDKKNRRQVEGALATGNEKRNGEQDDDNGVKDGENESAVELGLLAVSRVFFGHF